MEFSLICHPLSPAPAIESIHVNLSRLDDSKLLLCYRITGDIAAIVMPILVVPERTDNLWQTTCFEAFMMVPGNDRYAEFNFSPSTRWASYVFENYRVDRRDFTNSTLPRIDIMAGVDSYELRATVDIADNIDNWRGNDLAFGLSAIIETRDRRKSYWALAHPTGEPDFHHRDCFATILQAPAAA